MADDRVKRETHLALCSLLILPQLLQNSITWRAGANKVNLNLTEKQRKCETYELRS